MKYFAKLALVMVLAVSMLLLSSCGSNSSGMGTWTKQAYLDEFNQATDSMYVSIKANGTYSNSSISDVKMVAEMIVDLDKIEFRFRENDINLLANLTGMTDGYEIFVSNNNGEKYTFGGKLKDNAIQLNGRDRAGMLAALNEGGNIKFAIKSNSSDQTKYNFEINANNFESTAADALYQVPYQNGLTLKEQGEYTAAIEVFEGLDNYSDSVAQIKACREAIYSSAKVLLDEENIGGAAIAFYKTGYYQDAQELSARLWKSISVPIAAGGYHSLGVKADGTAVATKIIESSFGSDEGQSDVNEWTDIVSVSAGYSTSLGLKSDGTVVAAGHNLFKQNVTGWSDIVAVSEGSDHSLGLKSDGTVVATGLNSYGQCDVDEWTDIVAIAAGGTHSLGLKSDGTVVATAYTGDQEYNYGQCDVSEWTDIVAIVAGWNYSLGLKADGTVVAKGGNSWEQCDVSGWNDIVAIAAGFRHSLGLKSDGTVIATTHSYSESGYDFLDYSHLYNGQCNVSGWKNILVPEKFTEG